jgi:hypothetical protein
LFFRVLFLVVFSIVILKLKKKNDRIMIMMKKKQYGSIMIKWIMILDGMINIKLLKEPGINKIRIFY